MDENGNNGKGYWTVINSYVRQSQQRGKVTSVTICHPREKDNYNAQITFSDKTNPIRVRLSIDELAGLANNIAANKTWKCFHSYEKKPGEKMETTLEYNPPFINAQRAGHKIAMKLTEDETASLTLALKVSAYNLMEKKIHNG